MLQKLEKEIAREYAGYMETSKRFIRNGHEYDKDAGLKEYLTVGKWAKYEAGEMTRTEATKRACERMSKQYDKKVDKVLAHVRTCEAAEIPSFISIRVEWKKSTVWGSNPTAIHVLESIGYRKTSEHHGKTSDFYDFERI